MFKKKILFIVISLIILLSCDSNKKNSKQNNSQNTSEYNLEISDLDLSYLNISNESNVAVKHRKYLSDDFSFIEYEEVDINKGETPAVIGNKSTLFYPKGDMSDDYFALNVIDLTDDMKNNSKTITIPFGAIVPIIEQIQNADTKYYGMYAFENHYNYFYLTRYNGQEGYIFGSDLKKDHRGALEYSRITSELYKNNAVLTDFPDFVGYEPLKAPIKDRIEKEHVVFQDVDKSEYSLSMFRPDDMISLYQNNARDKYKPIFITTDLISNGLHLFFDKYLQFVEEKYFIPRLELLVNGYLEKISETEKLILDNEKYSEVVNNAKKYFQIAQCLINLAPDFIQTEDEYGRKQYEYRDKNKDEIITSYPEAVQQEIKLIIASEEFINSPNFDYKEDYTQFKPRGHYTKNGILESYFRTMMWFGRLHIYMSLSEDAFLADNPAIEISKKLMPIAGFLTDLTIKNNHLFERWENLFNPITSLIGISDDLSFHDVVPFWKTLGIDDFPKWVKNEQNIIEVLKIANKKLRSPLISGNSVFWAPSGEDQKPPMGWRLFGQRFTYDSFIHHNVSPPRLFDRNIVRGLDVMKAFGSLTADQLLRSKDYPIMKGLEEKLNEFETYFSSMDSDFWGKSYYNRVLYLIKSQANFEPGAGFYFTENPSWAIKSQLSSHGTWAALRHDTILYVKQSYAERAGDGDFNPTYRTLPVPTPVHYIEPNINFFKGALASIVDLDKICSNYDLADEEFKKKNKLWYTLLDRCLKIVKTEFKDEEVAQNDINWIRTIPEQIVPLVIPPGSSYSTYTDNSDALKGAIVADVFTNAELKKVLEVALGIPLRIYVALNDGQGGKRIAVGYVYNYYEFLQNQEERMNNEEWKALVYDKDSNLNDKKPFWAKNISLPSKDKIRNLLKNSVQK